jgi:hypothetical protein
MLTAGVARGLHGFGQDQVQIPHHIGYGCVVSDGNPARLAVEFGVGGNGDVSDGFHGPALLKNSALLAVFAMEVKLSAKRALGVDGPKREGGARFVVHHL